MNERRTDSLAARLQALAMQADDASTGRVIRGAAIAADITGPVHARIALDDSIRWLKRAIDLIDAELAESERGKPKPARKQKQKRNA